jgi:hypothetical protein
VNIERFGEGELLARLRAVRLVGFDGAQPYADAELEVTTVRPDDLAPAQRYVLRPGVERILELRNALMPHGEDPFALSGGLEVDTVPLIPPVIEESREPDGRTVLLIADGIHRVFAARSLGLPIAAVVVRRIPPEYPYYALALPGGWDDVAELDELPDGFQKKEYRVPDNYRRLFRDLDGQFPGVQTRRKASNPAHLRA